MSAHRLKARTTPLLHLQVDTTDASLHSVHHCTSEWVVARQKCSEEGKQTATTGDRAERPVGCALRQEYLTDHWPRRDVWVEWESSHPARSWRQATPHHRRKRCTQIDVRASAAINELEKQVRLASGHERMSQEAPPVGPGMPKHSVGANTRRVRQHWDISALESPVWVPPSLIAHLTSRILSPSSNMSYSGTFAL